ncbi:MAG TPA: LCP family protein [Streptosporangiaceae bacterium]
MTLGLEDEGRRPRSPRKIVLRSFAVFVALLLVGSVLAGYFIFKSDWDHINRVDVLKDLTGHRRPPADPKAQNILVIGSDTRAGANDKFGANIQGQRSDTIMLLHISPGAHQATVLSFPRDSMVPILSCTAEPGASGQTAQPGNLEQINATFAYGGPGCLWDTIEQTTGIHINDFIEMTFTGFEHVINDIGGVNICLPVAIHDSRSQLDLSAGKHHVYGKEALAFWRARYIGEGSDLQRIQRDQFLMVALVQGIERSGLTHSPTKLLRVIQDVVGHGYVTTDTQLSAGRLFTVANDLRGMKPGAAQFVEVPTVPYPGNPQNWVEFEQPQAGHLFAAIASDTKLPKTTKPATSGTSPAPQLDDVSPAQVSVTVLNGSGVPGIATSTSTRLAELGFHVVGPPQDAASQTYTKSVIEYASSANLPEAQTLAKLISNVRLEQVSSLPGGTLDLIVGSTFTSVKTPSTSASPSPTPSASSSGTEGLAGQYGGITGSQQICNDAGAFTGPDGTN